ncbi:MAG: DUF2309 domain-containing protein [Acidobacteria bacterium]|nr:DUF2309 domain-containing protein [Acidobacteriota bacterium]
MSAEERENLRQQVGEACEPVSPIWPLKTFAYRSPVRGFEHLSFDQAAQRGNRLFGGTGYLSNQEYRRLYREGRITDQSVREALDRVGPRADSDLVRTGVRNVEISEVFRLHLLHGIDALEPSLMTWTLNTKEGIERFRGDLSDESKRRILEKLRPEATGASQDREKQCVSQLWSTALAILNLTDSDSHESRQAEGVGSPPAAREPTLPTERTISDWLDTLTGSSLVEQINNQMMKWAAAFLDEGVAGWEMPSRAGGFYQGWRELASRDLSCRFLGIKNFSRKIRELPDSAEEAITLSLDRLQIPPERWKEYQSRLFAQLPGWTGFIRWLTENPEYPGQRTRPIDIVQFLAVRLFYEVELTDALCQREWGIAGTLPTLTTRWQTNSDEYRELTKKDSHHSDAWTDAVCQKAWRLFHLAQCLELTPDELEKFSKGDAQTLLEWLDAFPAGDHSAVWLEAYEDVYRRELIERLASHSSGRDTAEGRPLAQLLFCIDARSEPFRRYIEAQGTYETFGYAGFFGLPISHQAFDATVRLALCPVLLKPSFAVNESPAVGAQEPLQRYASGSRWRRLADELFHDLKANPISAFMLVDALGFFFSVGLTGKTLVMKPYGAVRDGIKRWFFSAVPTRIPVERAEPEPRDARPGGEEDVSAPLAMGFTLEEQATFAGNGLRIIGLTKNFGRFVVVAGHGSTSENNPYAAAYDCGACGGSHGDPNARVFAAMANDPEVRRLLKASGLEIPEDTWFLAGKHNTTTDRLSFYDLAEMPSSHAEDLRQLRSALEKAGADGARERCGRLPGVSRTMSAAEAYQHVLARSDDWANPRPEWGLSSNVGFIIGRRSHTQGLSLDGRVFLHSYDPESDPDGALLEKIMTAPLIVGEWINMEYYHSAVSPWVYGSGTKVIHNVVAGVGVMLGSQSDLKGGLPLQSVNDGALHYHEPMRLLAVIEAPTDRISMLIDRHAILQKLFHNGWVNLLALDPDTHAFHRYNTDSTWEPLLLKQAA